jgi:glycerol kinase
MPAFVGAIDQGTSSTRFIVFDRAGRECGRAQIEHAQVLPQPGWVEHDPREIVQRTLDAIAGGLAAAGVTARDLTAIGISNQRETTVVWDRRSGVPFGNAIVWQDTRTDAIAAQLARDGHADHIRATTGLPPATYFSAGKLRWILEHVAGVREAAARGDALFGTIDTWLVWNLTGGVNGGRHVTDVTNASRTMLMHLDTLQWDDAMLALFEVPRAMLPEICSSSDAQAYGTIAISAAAGVPLTAVLGDQHAALVGQVCFAPGEAKNTYGTGNFLLLNTGERIVRSTSGLLSTVAYRFGSAPAIYALEGSIAVTGAAIQWLRDQLGIIGDAAETEALAASVEDSADVYFVPAFSGLFAPYWRSDARGAIVGLTRHATRAHLARAALEAICYQSRDVVDAMERDSGVRLDVLSVDGGVTANALCMQLQADILGVDVRRPAVAETSALGAAYAAGLAVGVWSDTTELRANWHETARWTPQWSAQRRADGYARWRRAVDRTLDWIEIP